MSESIPTPTKSSTASPEPYRRWLPYWVALSKVCRENPGEWYFYDDMPVIYAHHIKKGMLRDFEPAGAFEAFSNAGRLNVRYVGEGGSDG